VKPPVVKPVATPVVEYVRVQPPEELLTPTKVPDFAQIEKNDSLEAEAAAAVRALRRCNEDKAEIATWSRGK
jgi:hypothetical protein